MNKIKIWNLLNAYTFKCDIIISIRISENIEKDKYLGIYIFLLKKKIEMKRFIMRLDFALLYFSLIIVYNLFSDKIILIYREADII